MEIVLVLLLLVVRSYCDEWKDPYDIYTVSDRKYRDPYDVNIFSGKRETAHEGESKFESKSADSGRSCKYIETCNDLVKDLVINIDRLLPSKLELDGYDVSLPIFLSLSDVQTIRSNAGSLSLQRSLLCNILHKSLGQKSFSSYFSSLKNFLNGILECFTSLKTFVPRISFYFKDFVLFQIVLIFATSAFWFITLRSVKFLIVWILICFFFLNVYTTYLHLLEKAVAERTSMFAHTNYKIPRECTHPTKSMLHKFTELFTGPTPVQLSEECKETYKKIQVSPEVEVSVMKAVTESSVVMFTHSVGQVIIMAEEISSEIAKSYPFMSKGIVKSVMLVIILIVVIIIFSICLGKDIHFFGVSISETSQHYRNVVQPIQIPVQPAAIEPQQSPQPVLSSDVHQAVLNVGFQTLLQQHNQTEIENQKKTSSFHRSLSEVHAPSEKRSDKYYKRSKSDKCLLLKNKPDDKQNKRLSVDNKHSSIGEESSVPASNYSSNVEEKRRIIDLKRSSINKTSKYSSSDILLDSDESFSDSSIDIRILPSKSLPGDKKYKKNVFDDISSED